MSKIKRFLKALAEGLFCLIIGIIGSLFAKNFLGSMAGSITLILAFVFVLWYVWNYGFSSSDKENQTGKMLPAINSIREESGKTHLIAQSDKLFSSKNILTIAGKGFLLPGFFVGVPLFIFYIAIKEMIQDSTNSLSLLEIVFSPALLFVLGWILMIGIGIYMLIRMLKKLQTLIQMEPGELLLEDWPFKLNQKNDVTFRRSYSEDIEVKKVSPRLICQAIYKVPDSDGKGTDTREKNIFEEEYSSFRPNGEGSVRHSFSVTVPEHEPPSIDHDDFKYEWLLEFDFENESFPNDSSKFKLLVLPEVSIKNGE